MKNFILFYFLLAALFAKAQRSEPDRDDNTIIIHTAQKADSNFAMCARLLASKGYAFEKSDRKIFSMTTAPKNYKGDDQYKISVVCKNNEVIIKPALSYAPMPGQVSWIDWTYTKSPENYKHKAYDKFLPDVTELKNASSTNTVEFTKEELQ